MKKIGLLHAFSIMALGFAHSMHHTRPHFCLDYEHNTDSACEINAPGTEATIYYVPVADFLAEQVPPNAPATIADMGVITVAHTFTAPKGFYSLQVTLDKNSVTHEFAGQSGSGNHKNSVKFFVKGNSAQLRGIVQQIVRDNLVFIVPLKDGTRAQIGAGTCKAEVTTNFDSKTDKSPDPRGWEFNVECYDPHIRYYNAGLAITLNTA